MIIKVQALDRPEAQSQNCSMLYLLKGLIPQFLVLRIPLVVCGSFTPAACTLTSQRHAAGRLETC